jgi:hypothetical protein
VADVPDMLTLERHRDLGGRLKVPYPRRVVFVVIGVVCLLGLLNVFGQRPSSASADVPEAKVTLYAPTDLRGGDFMEARVHITAKQDLKKAILKLDPGWAEGMSMNTVEPSPVGEASDDGRLSFQLGHIAAGTSFILFMQFQVNPTNLAWRRPQNLELDDGNRVVARIHRTITVYP